MGAYDYIVIGAGPADSVVASRLSEEAGASVLLLEAGPAAVPPGIDDPKNFASFFGSAVDWNYESAPQAGLAGRTTQQPRGRLIGGTSNLYGMMHQRCPAADYDGWEAAGATGWSYEAVRPVLVGLEDAQGESPDLGRGGPMPLTNAGDRAHIPLSDAFLAAAAERGHGVGRGLNGAELEGAGWIDFNVRDGRRFSSRAAYLEPTLASRANLTLVADAVATRLLLDGLDGERRCTGVEYARDGRLERAAAAREVVVCAGAIEAPKLLMLSGIGDPDELGRLGIAVAAELPGVGRGLHDHVMVWTRRALDRAPGPDRFANFEAALFLKSEPSSLAVADLEVICMAGSFDDFAARRDPTAIDLVAALVRPESRGAVRLARADWREAPLVDPNYLGEERDVQRLAAALAEARALLAAGAFSGWVGAELLPERRADRDLAAFVRGTALPQWHVAGSCRMGADSQAVVDPELRVRDVRGLRVADASVMPAITSGHCHAAVLMIAERAADFVRQAR